MADLHGKDVDSIAGAVISDPARLQALYEEVAIADAVYEASAREMAQACPLAAMLHMIGPVLWCAALWLPLKARGRTRLWWMRTVHQHHLQVCLLLSLLMFDTRPLDNYGGPYEFSEGVYGFQRCTQAQHQHCLLEVVYTFKMAKLVCTSKKVCTIM